MPDNAYQMMTAPTQKNAETIGMVASGLGGIAQKYMDQSAANKAFEQGSAAQFKGIETVSQATGVPMNPELADQFKNMGGMNAQQQAAFQNSLNQEAQRMQMLYGINQAQARAAQAQQGQGMQQFGSQIDYMIAGRNQPRGAVQPTMPTGAGGVDASLFPSVNQARVSPMGVYSTF